MVSSAEEVCNLGLAKIGHEGFIVSLTEDSKGARIMNALYRPMRDDVLRSHLWRFARKRAVLAPLTQTPAFDGGNYFKYPDDCLRIVGTDEDYFVQGARWVREGENILADTDVLRLVYLRRVEDVSQFDASFVNCLATRLAYEASLSIAKSQDLRAQLEREYRTALVRAAHCSAVETDGEKFISEAFTGSR